jgi:type IV pilus assembly protein PilB
MALVAKRIGELLVDGGVLSQSQLEQALFAQRKEGRKLGQLLIELGLVSETQVTQTLSRQLSVPWVSLYHVDFSRALLNLVTRETAEKYSLVPIFVRRVRKQGETLYVAMDDPTNEEAIAEVSRASSLAVKPMIACPSDIRAAIRVYYLGEANVAPAPSSSGGMAILPAPAPAAPGAVQLAPAPQPSVGAASQPIAKLAAAAPPPLPQPRKRPAATSTEVASTLAAGEESRPRMISISLVDGTTVQIPAPPKRPASLEDRHSSATDVSDLLTARDLASALRAVSHGAEATEILGMEPRWEALFSALLSILLKKGIIADWEFIEEFRRV